MHEDMDEFSVLTIVFSLQYAILQEGDVMGHSTCKEKLLHVIQESGLVSWSKARWQLFDGKQGIPTYSIL